MNYGAMTRNQILHALAPHFRNGLDSDAEIFTASQDEWLLRVHLEMWTARNMHVCYGCDSPQPDFIRAALAFGNLRLMQREWFG